MRTITAIALALSSVGRGAAAQDAPDPKAAAFDAYVTRAMNDWKTTGLAVAVVKDGKVVFSKGYGVREHGKAAPVDDRTLFAIASTTPPD